ncbi:MAG: metallophosphoesterase [Verrucomicrobia bacterium]|nr:metallophosphoesterase [Verrucomicrobiota bacterium]
MNKNDIKTDVTSGGFSRRQFLSKSILATALAGGWMTGGVSSALAQEPAKELSYSPPALSDPEAWSLILIPDTQTYIKFGRNQGICELMTAWIAENKKKLNMLTALQLGDLIEGNGLVESDLTEKNAGQVNQTGAQQWSAISKAFSRLDGVLPYVVCTGNHDYGIVSAENRSTQFPSYFPTNRNSAWNGVLVECCPNRDGAKTLENAAYALKTPHGRDLLFISLEFAPSDPVLNWAKELVNRDAFKDHFAVLVTHSYMQCLARGQNLIEKENYKVADANYGKAIWEKLIYPTQNIRMVFCGHIAGTKDPKENIGFRQDKNHAGKVVSQMLFDTQTLGGGWHGNGGDGWLRILEFSPNFKTVSVRTFSPLFSISPSTKNLAWAQEDYNQFSFEID